jgi:uncharacterized oxidoreductase
MKMTGNTILITGGTSGIGRALAETFAARGNNVIIAGRRQQLLDDIAKQTKGITGISLDVADPASIERFIKDVKNRFPDLNVLVNNAGIARLEDYTADAIDLTEALATVQTNLLSVMQLTAALLPSLKGKPNATIITTTSGLAFIPLPSTPTYCATKAFLHSWLESLRFQLRDSHVEILELAPPYVQTELGGPQQASDSRAMPLKAFIDEVMQILEQGKTEKGEILVQNVKPLRWAEKDGKYGQMLAAFGSF